MTRCMTAVAVAMILTGFCGRAAAETGFSWVDEAGSLRLYWRARPVLQYNYMAVSPPDGVAQAFRRSAYIHPIWNPAGEIVTDDFAADHFHHRGVWLAWSKTEIGDMQANFWELQEGTGRIVFDHFEKRSTDDRRAVLIACHLWQSPRGDEWLTVLRERWTLVAHAPRDARQDFWQFDLTSTLACPAEDPVVIVQLRYGGLGFRGPALWTQKQEAVTVLTSAGDNRATANETRPRWCYMGGPLGTGRGGLTLMDDPGNPRAPTPVRVHPNMPFFCYMPAQKESYTIAAGRPLIQRYGAVIHASEPSADVLQAIWQQFAGAADSK